jgi:hypothetical protein
LPKTYREEKKRKKKDGQKSLGLSYSLKLSLHDFSDDENIQFRVYPAEEVFHWRTFLNIFHVKTTCPDYV